MSISTDQEETIKRMFKESNLIVIDKREAYISYMHQRETKTWEIIQELKRLYIEGLTEYLPNKEKLGYEPSSGEARETEEIVAQRHSQALKIGERKDIYRSIKNMEPIERGRTTLTSDNSI